MSFIFKCPRCKQDIEALEDWIGQKSNCPGCGTNITIEKTKETKSVEIQLIPIESSQTTPQPTFLNGEPKRDNSLVDSDEDNFVLRSLYTFKLINWIIAWVVSILLVLGALICLGSHAYSVGFGMLGSILVVVYVYFLENLILSWFRGIYRNLMWLKVISQTMPAPKLTSEKK